MPHASTAEAYLAGWGSYHPEGALTNAELCRRMDTTSDWLLRHTGIAERRVAGPGDTVATMGATAVERALDVAGWEAHDLDLLICATSFNDMEMPAGAARIAATLGIEAQAFDVNAACSGWLAGVEVASALLGSGTVRRAAVVASELATLGADYTDRANSIFFGDAAAAGLVSSEPPQRGLRVVDRIWLSQNRDHELVTVPRGGAFTMEAHPTKAWVEKAMLAAAGELLDRNGLAPAELRGLACHQANLRLVEWVADQLGVDPRRHWHNVEWAGNTSAAGVPSCLAEGLANADLAAGDPVLAVAVGAGLNAAGLLLRWVGG